jgi:tetratricopeptide (TPR) repeat protein
MRRDGTALGDAVLGALLSRLVMMRRVVCVVLLSCAPCLAQDPPSAPVNPEAQVQFEQGVSAYEDGRYRDAVDRFKEADRLAPSPLLSFNIAKVYERMQDPKSALAAYREYLRRLPDADNRLETSQRIAELELTLQKQGIQQVTIVTSPPGATVLIDDTARGVTPWTGELAPGPHHLVVRLPEHTDATRTFELPARHAIDLELQLAPAEVPAPAPVAPAPAPAPLPEASPAPSWWTWTLFGGSAALLAGSAAFELSRRSAEHSAADNPIQIDSNAEWKVMERRQLIARVLLGSGLAVGAIGGVSLFFDLRRSSEDRAKLGFACEGDGCRMLARGSF